MSTTQPSNCRPVHKTQFQASSDVLHSALPPLPTPHSSCKVTSLGVERLVSCDFAARRLQSWASISLRPKLRMPQDHRVRRRHSLPAVRFQKQELPVRGETRYAVALPRLWTFRALTPAPKHTTTLSKARAAAGPGRGRLAPKAPTSSINTSSSPRASLCNFMSK